MNIPPLYFVRFAGPAPIIQRGLFWYSVYRHLRLLVSPALLGDLYCFINYHYLATQISNISRIPGRVYEGQRLDFFSDPLDFPTDPALLYLEEFFTIEKNLSYYITPFHQYYGIIRYEDHMLVIGPTYQVALNHSQKREFMFLLGIQASYQDYYQKLLDRITSMPLDIFLHELCLIYYFITEKEISVSDTLLIGSIAGVPIKNEALTIARDFSVTNFITPVTTHNTLELEKLMLSYVSEGNLKELEELFSNLSVGQAGVMADNYLRQFTAAGSTTSSAGGLDKPLRGLL